MWNASNICRSGLATFVALGAFCTIASAQQRPVTRDLTVEQAGVYDVTAPKSDLVVSAWVDRTDNNYKPGDALQLFVRANQDAYITIVDVGTSGKVHVLFPNKYQKDNRILAHQVLQIPGADASWRVKVGGPPGQELIKVIATLKPDAVINHERLAELGPLYQYRDTAQTLTRDLGVELNERHRGGSATFEQIVRILPETGQLSRPVGQASVGTPPATPSSATTVPPEDLFKLGESQFYGDAGRINHREALRYFTAAADAGHVGAMYFIGRIHEAGQDVDASPAHALTWYRKAADLGSTQAMVRLAMLHASKDNPQRDLALTISWLRKAAAQGDSMAMIHLAKMHDDGIGVDRAPKDAAKFLLAALKGGAWTVIDQVTKFSDDARREVQAALRNSGHYNGPVDSRIGAETRAAMVEWAKAG